MLLVSGVNFGLQPTIPDILGINLGFSAMVLGVGGVFSVFPNLHDILRYGGAVYLIYLAWRIAFSGGMDLKGGRGFISTF